MTAPRKQRSWIWPATAAVFAVMLALTALVWRQQVGYQRRLVQSHTEDVAAHVARRLELYLESRLGAGRLFARRWSEHGRRDYSRERFEEFAPLLLEAMPGLSAMRLRPAPAGTLWTAPASAATAPAAPDTALAALREHAARAGEPLLSAPRSAGQPSAHVVAALPLRRDGAELGSLEIDLDVASMLEVSFPDVLRGEFAAELRDDAALLARIGPAPAADGRAPEPPARATRRLTALNRVWTLSLAPLPGAVARAAGPPPLAAPLLGLSLSLAFSLLTYQLLHRMALTRDARDRALSEIAAREAAQQALRMSESRYRGVFNAATDGLMVLDEDDGVMEINAAASAMFGREPVELRGRPLAELLGTDGEQAAAEFARQRGTVGAVRFDTSLLRRDGSRLEVEVRGTPLRYGSAPRTLVILTDVTARKRAEQQYAQLSRKVLQAQEEERLRLSRDLHDELGQLLTAIRLELGWLQRQPSRASADQRAACRHSVELVEKAADELRRICRGLRPPLLDDLGLAPAIRQLVEEFRERTGLAIELDLPRQDELAAVPVEASLCSYRILQEALTNITRHAEARAVSISLVRAPAALTLSVYDDGRGFALSDMDSTPGSGLAGMRERARLAGGVLTIRSAQFQGTRIVLSVPLAG